MIDMVKYVESMLKSFPEKDLHGAKVKRPWNDHLLNLGQESKVTKSGAVTFNTVTAQILFSCKASPEVAYLITWQCSVATMNSTTRKRCVGELFNSIFYVQTRIKFTSPVCRKICF